MILTDGVHLVSTNSLPELHGFARRIGLRRGWFQDHPRHPHYDLTTERVRQRALTAGAVLVTARQLVHSITVR